MSLPVILSFDDKKNIIAITQPRPTTSSRLTVTGLTHNVKMHISIRTRKISLTNIISYDKRNIDLIKNAFFFNFANNELYFFFIYIFKSWIYIHLNVSARYFSEKSILRIFSCLFYGVKIILIPIKMKKLSLVVDQEFGPKIGLRPIFRPPFLRN